MKLSMMVRSAKYLKKIFCSDTNFARNLYHIANERMRFYIAFYKVKYIALHSNISQKDGENSPSFLLNNE